MSDTEQWQPTLAVFTVQRPYGLRMVRRRNTVVETSRPSYVL